MRHCVGIEIGGTKLQIVRGDETCAVLERHKLKVTPEAGGAGIRAQLAALLPEMLANVDAVGVGFGGPVDWKRGRICRSHQIEGWSEFDLAGWLGSLGAPRVVVENDANTATLGEARHGRGKGFDPVFYITLGSGVGGGLVVDGRIYHGATPGEAEIGHVRLNPEGATVESRCSGWAVDRRIRELVEGGSNGLLARLASEDPVAPARHLGAALEHGDPAALRILREVAEDLSLALSHVAHLFHPEIIILGGGLSGVGEPLRLAIELSWRRFVMDAFAPGPVIALAGLGEDAVPVGALELARGVVPLN
jgi:glucokinase